MNTLLETNLFQREHFILNFTPLRPVIKEKYLDVPVLTGGVGKIHDISVDCGLKYFIHMEEYASYKRYEGRDNRPDRNNIIETLMKRYDSTIILILGILRKRSRRCNFQHPSCIDASWLNILGGYPQSKIDIIFRP